MCDESKSMLFNYKFNVYEESIRGTMYISARLAENPIFG